jgi:metal-responsive CopG/Arc/MetJ family transcriptional regulator
MPKKIDKIEKKKNITINIPESFDIGIDLLIKAKLIESRSEGVRNAVKEFFKEDKRFIKSLVNLTKRRNLTLNEDRHN